MSEAKMKVLAHLAAKLILENKSFVSRHVGSIRQFLMSQIPTNHVYFKMQKDNGMLFKIESSSGCADMRVPKEVQVAVLLAWVHDEWHPSQFGSDIDAALILEALSDMQGEKAWQLNI